VEHWQGYARMLAAEAFIGVSRFDEALEALRVGIPILRREGAYVELAHAMNLFFKVPKRSAKNRERFTKMLAESRGLD
jgi:hypothetical protein